MKLEMKHILVAAVSVISLSLSGCSSSEKQTDVVTKTTEAKKKTVSATGSMGSDELLQKYSLGELNAAATALRVVADEGASAPTEDRGSDLIGCAMTSKEALTLTMPVKALIDQSMRTEAEAYSQNPKAYSSEKGFETCAANCACGVFQDVVDRSNESSIPANSAKIHARNKVRLAAKASKQGKSDSMSCARKANWLCNSELLTYLRTDANENAQ